MGKYVPSIGFANWDIDKLDKESRMELKNGIVACITHDENEYKAILSYLHMKFPEEMDIRDGDGAKFQWRYHTFDSKVKAYDSVGKCDFDMYALVYYDSNRDMEPIAVGGSYIRETGAIRDPYTHLPLEGQIINKHTSRIRCGHGYVLFIDPSYRRLGLARDQWLTEAQLYRDSDIHYQKENQTYGALKVTLSMFEDKSKCHILNNRKLETIKDGMNTKIIMDYFDNELINEFNMLQDSLKSFRNPLNWHFLTRENLSIDDLLKPWEDLNKKIASGKRFGSKINLSLSIDRDLYERFKNTVGNSNVKEYLIEYMKWVVNK